MKTAYLTFDDAVISHLAVAAPLLKEFGFGATFFVCKWPGDSIYQMNWHQIEALAEMGFEIGNHTVNHLFMPQTSSEEAEKDIILLERKMAEYNIPRPVSFAYPGGADTPECRNILRDRGYRTARTIREEPVIAGVDDPLSIGSFVIKDANDNFSKAMEALTESNPVVLTWHGVPEYLHQNVQTSIPVFLEQLTYLRDNNIRCCALRELAV
jgi:peptidoglycan/xylan/chitin deacetylase (PgdA/CDA1 family)